MIYEKLMNIMKECSHLLKDLSVGTGRYEYKGVSDEQVKIKVREGMIAQRVFGHVKNIEVSKTVDSWVDGEKRKSSYVYDVKGTYVFVDVDSPESILEVPFFGYSIDSGDKADGKAMTYALKYMFINTFVMPSGNDPDRVHSNDIQRNNTKPVSNTNPPPSSNTSPQPKKVVEKKTPIFRNMPFENEYYTILKDLVKRKIIPYNQYYVIVDGWGKIKSFQSSFDKLKSKYYPQSPPVKQSVQRPVNMSNSFLRDPVFRNMPFEKEYLGYLKTCTNQKKMSLIEYNSIIDNWGNVERFESDMIRVNVVLQEREKG